LCLYDNAGEHFHPGLDTTSAPGTRHMAQAAFLMFLFDPLQDVRFRQWCQQGRPGIEAIAGKATRQETVLLEAPGRVRPALSLPQNARHQRPMIVVLTKADVWGQLLPDPQPREPWVAKEKLSGLDVDRVEQRSGQLRELLLRTCPEVVSAAE